MYLLLKRKRTSDQTVEPTCIVHVKGLKYGELQLMSGMRDAEKKFVKLQEIKEKRLSEHPTSTHRMEDTCKLIPNTVMEYHGFHWECYKRFIMKMDRLTSTSSPPSDASTPQRTSRITSTEGDKIIFKSDCIFCGSEGRKTVKVKSTWTSQGMSQFEFDECKTVATMAEIKQDEKFLTRIRSVCL